MTIQDIEGKTFDFIICGGGAAGLVLAARLTENSKFNVLVVEAGSDRRDDFLVNTPGTFLQLYGNPNYDWDFTTTPQKEANGDRFAWPRGKGLGGSAMINFLMYSHCSKGDINAWREVGNPGWGWDDLLPYFRKVEHIHIPDDAARTALDLGYIQPEIRGKDGPIHTSFPRDAFTWAQRAWSKQSTSMGYPTATDPRTGSSLGLFCQLTSVDPETGRRSYCANTYLKHAEERPNLTVVTETLVKKVVFENSGPNGQPKASGVEIVAQGQVATIKASHEVILCAGSIQTPQILELSGIGGRVLLERHQIPVVVDNANVGENLMDHVIIPLSYQVNEGVETAEAMRDNPELVTQAMEAYTTTKGGPLAQASSLSGFLPSQIVAPDANLEALARSGPKLPGKQLEILLSQLRDPKEAEYQVVTLPTGLDVSSRHSISGLFMHSIPGNYVSLGIGSAHEFSRGSCHIVSNSIHDHPDIDPNYFSNPVDLEKLAHGLLHAQQIAATPPLADYIKSVPGTDGREKIAMEGQPRFDTLDQARKWARKTAMTMYHPIATASMLPRDDGGVVDSSLRVYGAEGLRVIDASIFPLHVQGNIMSLVYAVAEKGADIIKAAYA